MKSFLKEITRGITKENPTFILVLGLCPTLAVSVSLINGFGMGIAATFVLLGSNIIISSIRNVVPDKIRIPCFIVVIATFVTLVDMSMEAYTPVLDRALGIYVPLIVVNCIVLGRAEAYAQKNPVLDSLADAIGMGIGFTLALLLISGIRELIGTGTFWGYPVIKSFDPALLFSLPAGALLVIGLLLGFFNWLKFRRE